MKLFKWFLCSALVSATLGAVAFASATSCTGVAEFDLKYGVKILANAQSVASQLVYARCDDLDRRRTKHTVSCNSIDDCYRQFQDFRDGKLDNCFIPGIFFKEDELNSANQVISSLSVYIDLRNGILTSLEETGHPL